jgi:hypothetical protein
MDQKNKVLNPKFRLYWCLIEFGDTVSDIGILTPLVN